MPSVSTTRIGRTSTGAVVAGVPTIDLEQGLSRVPCPKCGVGQVRPTDIHDGAHLSFSCPIPRCDFHARALLPRLRKKLLYLDTSVWIQIARAYVSKADPAWVELHKCLRGAAGDNVLLLRVLPDHPRGGGARARRRGDFAAAAFGRREPMPNCAGGEGSAAAARVGPRSGRPTASRRDKASARGCFRGKRHGRTVGSRLATWICTWRLLASGSMREGQTAPRTGTLFNPSSRSTRAEVSAMRRFAI